MKLAIIRRNGLGDLVSATIPLCNFIRERFPECELHLFLSEMNFLLMKYFISPKNCIYTHEILPGNKYIQTLLSAVKVRKLNFDIAISPVPLYPKLNSLFLLGCGARKRYGADTGSIFEKICLTHKTKLEGNKHVALQTINLLDKSVTEIDKSWFPKIEKNAIIKNLSICGNKGPFLLVEMSNNRQTSRMENSKLSEILNNLNKKKPFSCLITLKEKDIEKAKELQEMLTMHSEIILTPTIDDFIALVNKADIFLLGDGGAGHIAGALDKPGVALYGVTSVNRWGVLSDKVIHLHDPVDVNNIEDKKIEKALIDVFDNSGF